MAPSRKTRRRKSKPVPKDSVDTENTCRAEQQPPAKRRRGGAVVSPVRATRDDEPTGVDVMTTEVSLNALTSLSCNIFHVSLLQISQTPQDLSRFCRELENNLAEDASLLLERKKEATFQVNAFLLPGIKKSPHDAESLMIEVFRQAVIDAGSDNEEKEDRKLIFRALFTSCDSNGSSLRSLKHNVNAPKNLPVFLWYGKSRVWEHIRPILEASLKCNFHPVHFSPVHMQIFTGLWLHQELKRGSTEKNSDGVSIEYQLPVHRKSPEKENPVTSVELSFATWKKKLLDVDGVLDNNLCLKQELMKVWQEALDNYNAVYKVDLSRADFLKVRTTSCVISSRGRVKLRKGMKLGEFQPIFTQLTRIVELR